MRKFEKIFLGWSLAVLFLLPAGAAIGQDAGGTPKKAEEMVPRSELDKLKAEWEAVREQQVQMIREKEDQLEKLKEEIFSKMKVSAGPAVTGDRAGLEAQRAALQAERQKFSAEMNRQKEILLKLQAGLEKEAKQLKAERDLFEQEKKTAAR